MTPAQIGRAYGIEVFNYTGRRRGALVCGGTGLMLAIMDVLPIAHCIDADSLDERSDAIASAMLLLARYSAPLLVAGWFTSKRPDKLRAGVAMCERHGLGERTLCYVGGATGHLADGQHTWLASYLDAGRAMLAGPVGR